jgi:hypothetical protein
MIAATPDRFRGTIQRWTVDAGPLAGTTCEHVFNEDWSMTWRLVTGADQGRVGRARVFLVQPVRSQLYIVAFSRAEGEDVTAAVDFASRRFVGFVTREARIEPYSGSIETI